MQKFLSLLLFLVSTSLFGQQSQIQISGTVEFPKEDVLIVISKIDNHDKIVVDSIVIQSDKTFSKSIEIPSPGLYELNCQQWEKLNFWGENEDIVINFKGQDTSAEVNRFHPPYSHIETAGENNELMNLVNYSDYRTQQAGSRAIKYLNVARKNKNELWEKSIFESFHNAKNAGADNIDYLAKHYKDRNSVMAIVPRIKDEAVLDEVLSYFEAHKPDYPIYQKYKKEKSDRDAKLAKVASGTIAPDFPYVYRDDLTGNDLKQYRGKYLLIDFWASWCGPCRKSIPALKELYEKYKSAEFDILSVSIDSDRSNWLEALDEENMSWQQVFTEDVGKEVMSKYQFGYIPFLVLVDGEGKIVERGISLDKLKKMLESGF